MNIKKIIIFRSIEEGHVKLCRKCIQSVVRDLREYKNQRFICKSYNESLLRRNPHEKESHWRA